MQLIINKSLGLLILLIILVACGTEETSITGETQTELKRTTGLPVDQYPTTYGELKPNTGIKVDEFDNFVLGEDNQISSEKQSLCTFRTKTIDNDETVLIATVDNAVDWNTFYWIIHYNPAKFNPKNIFVGKFFGPKSDNLILQRLDRKGVVIFGLAHRGPGKHGLITGSGVLAEIYFKNSPYNVKTHDVPEPQKEDLPRVINPVITDKGSGNVLISFNEYLPADFNGNGIVDLPDMAVIAAYYNLRVSGNEKIDSTLKYLDISKDGLVEYADFDPIVRSLGLRIEGFRIYRDTERQVLSSEDQFLPATGSFINSARPKYSISREVVYSNQPLNRTKWEYIDAQGYGGEKDTRPELEYRIISYPDVTGKNMPVAIAKLPREPLNQMRPVWVGKPGIIQAAANNKYILISFGKAKAPEGVKYRLYYTYASTPQKTGANKIEDVKSPYILGKNADERLIPNKEYKLLVVAYRNDKPLIESINSEWSSASISLDAPADIDPPSWNDRIGVYSGSAGNGTVKLNYGIASDSQSMPITYRIYYSLKGTPDPAIDDYIETTESSSCIIDSLKNGKSYTFMVRALDSSLPANEDTNNRTITLTPNENSVESLVPPKWNNSIQAGVYRIVAGNQSSIVYFGSAKSSTNTGQVSYKVHYNLGNKPNFDSHESFDTNQSPITITELINNKMYTVWVTAFDENQLENTTAKFLQVRPENTEKAQNSIPKFPNNNPSLTIREDNHNLILAWQPASANGSVVRYRVYWQDGKSTDVNYQSAEDNDRMITLNVPRLILDKYFKSGKSYTVAVKAVTGKSENNSVLLDGNEYSLVVTMPGAASVTAESSDEEAEASSDQTQTDKETSKSAQKSNHTSK